MERQKKGISLKGNIDRVVIVIFCLIAAFSVGLVLLTTYRPAQNTLEALASTSLDVLSMIILMILVVSLSFEEEKIGKTTRLFLGLMLATVFALLFDFLNWAYDGSLSFDNYTFLFTITSLGMGAVLGAILVAYLSSYLKDMHNIKMPFHSDKICIVANAIAYVLTIILGITRNAFVIIDGHYKTGSLYDLVTAIPVATLIFMTIYMFKNIKIIGVKDVLAVAGYLLTMIVGALIEGTYSIGTTYVSIAVADVFIFVMLQSKVIGRVKQQKKTLTEQVTNQFQILESMASIYSYVNFVDVENSFAKRFDKPDSPKELLDLEANPHSLFNIRLYDGIEKDLQDKFWAFTDISTLSDRMGKEKIISAEFLHKDEGWFRASYIRIESSSDDKLKKVIYAVRNIDEEKKNVEKWIKKSNTDELTGLLNRHGYEEEMALLEKGGLKNNFVYVALDVNGLKTVNDTYGHEAGDELIIGTSECMKRCFSAYGNLYRTGGDEFVALIYADKNQLTEIMHDLEETTEKWEGIFNKTLTVSSGFVTKEEAKDMTLHQIAAFADKRMYEDKARYYQKKGIDRRGQRNAHIALCALYTKILKINLSEDTYQVINMNQEDTTLENGFSNKLSDWFKNNGTSGQVHPENLQEYLSKVNLDYLKTYFNTNKNLFRIFYLRRYSEGYKRVMLEIIPANDYSDENQSMYLYEKEIEDNV